MHGGKILRPLASSFWHFKYLGDKRIPNTYKSPQEIKASHLKWNFKITYKEIKSWDVGQLKN